MTDLEILFGVHIQKAGRIHLDCQKLYRYFPHKIKFTEESREIISCTSSEDKVKTEVHTSSLC